MAQVPKKLPDAGPSAVAGGSKKLPEKPAQQGLAESSQATQPQPAHQQVDAQAGAQTPAPAQGDRAAKTADTAQKAASAIQSKGTSVASDAAGKAASSALGGNSNSQAGQNVGRYAGAAAEGAVQGAAVGGAAGAGVGAVKGVAVEGVKDVGKDLSKGEDSKIGRTAMLAGGGAATAAAAPAVAWGMMLMIWLKSLFQLAIGLINAVKGVLAYILGVLKAIGHGIATAWSAVTGFFSSLGMGSTAAAVAAGTSVALAVGSGGIVGGSVIAAATMKYDDAMFSVNDCTVVARPASLSGDDGDGEAVDATTEKNAKTVYSVLSSIGMSDVNISGILGNWDTESGIDSTAVFGVYDERFQIGPKKQAAWDNNFTGLYAGIEHGGIGLGQWINGRNQNLLAYADDLSADWHELPVQLGFMFSSYEGSDANIVRGMVSDEKDSPRDAALYFHDEWERSAQEAIPQRLAAAEKWYALMSDWTVDEDLVDDVEGMLGQDLDDLMEGDATNPRDGEGSGTIRTATQLDEFCADVMSGPQGSTVGLTDGGLTLEQAEAIAETYNNGDADKVIGEHGGGPGKYQGSWVMNCVSLSWYFMWKYTTYQGHYVGNNGGLNAYSTAQALGLPYSKNPTVYSIFSNYDYSSLGHTGAVVGADGDRILIIEAAYGAWPARARWVEASEWKANGWYFTDISSIIDKDAELDGTPKEPAAADAS